MSNTADGASEFYRQYARRFKLVYMKRCESEKRKQWQYRMSLLRKCSASAVTLYICPHGSIAVWILGPLALSAGQSCGRSAKTTSDVSSCIILQKSETLESTTSTVCSPHRLCQFPTPLDAAHATSRARLWVICCHRPLLNVRRALACR